MRRLIRFMGMMSISRSAVVAIRSSDMLAISEAWRVPLHLGRPDGIIKQKSIL